MKIQTSVRSERTQMLNRYWQTGCKKFADHFHCFCPILVQSHVIIHRRSRCHYAHTVTYCRVIRWLHDPCLRVGHSPTNQPCPVLLLSHGITSVSLPFHSVAISCFILPFPHHRSPFSLRGCRIPCCPLIDDESNPPTLNRTCRAHVDSSTTASCLP